MIFLVSVGVIALMSAIAVGVYTYHLVLIRQINQSDSIVDKRWFRLLFSGIGWTHIVKAMEYTKEIEAFKREA